MHILAIICFTYIYMHICICVDNFIYKYTFLFTGEKNPIVKLAVIQVPSHPDIKKSGSDLPQKPVGTNNAIWMNLVKNGNPDIHVLYPGAGGPDLNIVSPSSDDYYLARVGWFTDGSVMAQVIIYVFIYIYIHICIYLCVCRCIYI
jgi:hypothetical protein